MKTIQMLIRLALLVLNAACLLCGVTLIIKDLPLITFPLGKSAASCLVLGCTIVLVSFIGCCGIMKESFCMTTTYAILMSLLLMGQLVFREVLMEILKDSIWKNEIIDKTELENYFWIATVVQYVMLILSCYLCHSETIKQPSREPSVPIHVH